MASGLAGPSSSVTPRRQRSRNRPLHAGLVDAREGVAGMEEPVREGPVVREQERTLYVPVEAAHRIQADLPRHEVRDDRPALRVAEGRDVAPRLVEEHVPLRFGRRQGPSVDRDLIQHGIGQGGGTRRDDTVDGHVAVNDQAVTAPSRGQTRLGQDLVESQLRHARRHPPAPG